MASPYATVIVPIIDRAETLAIALTTGLAQTCRDIEILVTCTGATPAVLEVAWAFARRDPRVRVLDLPRSPASTAAARAEALRQAGSDRIFILQDDDLWFPDHVATLGALLDHSDFVTTVSMAATLSGSIAAWPCTFGNAAYRQVFAKGAPKVLYEAHYAFRRSSYTRLDVGWERQTTRDCSRHLLEAHLAQASSVRWACATAPTALSLNSPPRARMTTPQRAREMRDWLQRMQAGMTADKLLASASYGPMLEGLLQTEPPEPGSAVSDHLARYGLQALPVADATAEGSLPMSLSERQREDLTGIFRILTRAKVPMEIAERVVADMLEPFASSDIRLSFLERLRNTYGPSGAFAILAAAVAVESNAYRLALLEAATASLYLESGHIAEASRHWREAEAASPLAAAGCWEIAAALALAENRTSDAAELMASEIARGRGHPRHFLRFIRLQLGRGERERARAAMAQGLAAFPEDARLLALARKSGLNAAADQIATVSPTG